MVLLRSGIAQEAEEDLVWTESLYSKEGVYAISINSTRKEIVLLRVDERENTNIYLRVSILNGSTKPLDVSLRKIESAESPYRYIAEVKGWDGALSGFELQGSADGRKWHSISSISKIITP